MHNAIIFLAYIPSPNRIQKYVNVLAEYCKDHDIYISITYTVYYERFLEALNKANIKYQHVTALKYDQDVLMREGISLYLQHENKKSKVVHFLSTNGINYSSDNFDNNFELNFHSYCRKLIFIEKFLNDKSLCGSYSEYGHIKHDWYLSKDQKNCATSLENSCNIVHPMMDWSNNYKFDILPMRTQWSGSFSIKNSILTEFFKNVDIVKLNMFESNISQIVCRFGFLKHINNFYKPFAGSRHIERNLIEHWIIENNLLITSTDLSDYFS
jgi:hypothetical protein